MLKRMLGIVGWVGTILVFAAVAVRFLRPAWQQYAYWTAWAGLVCILVYALGQWREVARLFSRRQAQLGTLAATSILVVLGILVAINYLAARENKRWDLTANQQFTLSDQTRKIVGSLDAPLKMTVFARESEFPRYQNRLPEYEYASKKVSVEYVDPDKKPGVARQYNIQSYGTIALEYKGRIERITSDSEQDITNGIIKVVTGQQKKIYFVQGHGEKDTASSERTGYSGVAQALGRDNYAVEKLVLAQQSHVPTDASALVVAGPTTDFLPTEIDMLRQYLQQGGKVLFLLDPAAKTGSAPLTNIAGLLRDWDIQVGNDVIIDASGIGQLFGGDATVPVAAPPYPSHPITDNFRLLTAYPMARSVTAIPGGVNGHNAQPFAQTSAQSFTKPDAEMQKLMATTNPRVALDAKTDKRGPIDLGVAVSAPAAEAPAVPVSADKDKGAKPETRVVAMGDSDFAANYALGIQGNQDMFLNTVNWLAQQENLISIRPRDPEDRRITLTADAQARITWLVLLIIPGLIIGTGVYTWWRRR
jgi:ABC-type uncharacterized transport system involved in gliding motility auxiliary subunit